MTDTKFLESLEDEFKEYNKLLNEYSGVLYHDYHGHRQDQDELISAGYWCEKYLVRMYHIASVYLEHQNLLQYLEEFKKSFEPYKVDHSKLLDYDMFPIGHGEFEHEMKIIIEWSNLLSPFNLFGSAEEKEIERKSSKLINILKSTNEIIKSTNRTIKNENDINSLIREVCSWFFSGVVSYSDGYFTHKFKNYRPDVIVSEVGVAVEYKLVKHDKDIGNKLDELLIDAKRYSGNSRNRMCIAVFCLTKKISKTKKEIREDWQNIEFPKNWRLIIIPDLAMENN